jgi:adenylate cyclase
MPILRGQVAFRILHPLYDASTMNWIAERGVVVDHFKPDDSGSERFLRSPISHALTHRLPVLRRRLTGETALFDFEVLEEFRALGGTDYLVFRVPFDPTRESGVICTWLGDRAAGFTDHEIAQNVAHAYLGKRAGQAVLNGLIRRGDGEKITAALWYSDLRHSTELADRLTAETFLSLLGRYFEMTAAAVLDHGGEVVSLIGDAVLGLFRFEGAPNEACGRALAAS